jgi:hypothetical protein
MIPRLAAHSQVTTRCGVTAIPPPMFRRRFPTARSSAKMPRGNGQVMKVEIANAPIEEPRF